MEHSCIWAIAQKISKDVLYHNTTKVIDVDDYIKIEVKTITEIRKELING